MGMIVDSVSEVMPLAGTEIEEPPDVGGVETETILGVAQKENKVIMLLDVDKVMNLEELVVLESVA